MLDKVMICSDAGVLERLCVEVRVCWRDDALCGAVLICRAELMV